jgi:hypothetical protein
MFKRNQLMMDSVGDVMIILRKSTKLKGIRYKWLMVDGVINHPIMNSTIYKVDRDWIKSNFTPITKEVMEIMVKGV